jgi:hypothetical protein
VNQTKRIVTCGDLHACLKQFPPNTTFRVTANENGLVGILISPIDHYATQEERTTVETYGEALELEDLANALVVDHVAAILRHEPVGMNSHVGSMRGNQWWTECLGCSDCRPEEYHPQDDTGAKRGPHGG